MQTEYTTFSDTTEVMVAMPETILQRWSFLPRRACRTLVMPDGCRDLIASALPAARPRWFVSELACTTISVPCASGQSYVGFRFQPAVTFDQTRLLAAVQDSCPSEEDRVLAIIDDYVRTDERVSEALLALAQCHHTSQAACALGVSARTLERLLLRRTKRPPLFWRRLSRVRSAARQIGENTDLATLAADCGFSDQSHMNREFRIWFGVAPGAFRASQSFQSIVKESGYA